MDPQLPLRILEAVRLLHRLGYRGLRILPGLNASGTAWRIIVFNVTEWRTGDEFGAPYDEKESCRYSTADENVFNESIQFPADVSHIDVAEAIIDAMPSLKRSGFEETGNRAYMDWYSQLMSQVSKLTDLPIAYSDYGDFDEAWGLGLGTGRYFPKPPKYTPEPQLTSKRAKSDEYYVLKLCNEVLGSGCQQQKTFDWLLGLPSKNTGLRASLPVDGYWEDWGLVVEYHEKQHSEAVPFFDNKVTASGHLRGEQRKLYDAQKATMIPEQGLTLLIIDYRDFENAKGKIVRNHEKDLLVVERMIKDVLQQPIGDHR
ncbi:hypothetical protein SLW73_17110 [Glutamicibacter protophormiae]|uniref:hypothetical protein n=1 Tax=Glutamicibacter protophormiae TaxID=37930 RepID=UPI002A808423|nr:hypothetical protein [Glutamicibacter protophormiae]WPR64588.1 hypothetical protein SLW72_17120 [Glutamicibacter protophormiae]WPR68082.1 hypothetical protein SLW73_17110 [Glutamicibacter protophormiae]